MKKLNEVCSKIFFELWAVDYAKMLINIKNADKNKGIVAEAKDRISSLKESIRKWAKKKKNIKMRIKH